jgi:hypothetical protein
MSGASGGASASSRNVIFATVVAHGLLCDSARAGFCAPAGIFWYAAAADTPDN